MWKVSTVPYHWNLDVTSIGISMQGCAIVDPLIVDLYRHGPTNQTEIQCILATHTYPHKVAVKTTDTKCMLTSITQPSEDLDAVPAWQGFCQ